MFEMPKIIKRSPSPSFVCELPLRTTLSDERKLGVRLEMARQVYNACLGESLRVLALMRESRDWQRAKAMPKGKKRSARFQEIVNRFDFKQSAIDRFAIACKNGCSIRDHLGAHVTQATAKRAFSAVRQYAFGKRGRPRFKGHRGLRSAEGKTNAAGIRFRDGRILWNGLSIPAMFDPRDRDGWQAMALASETKYCRIVRRTLRGRDRWHVQLVQKGTLPRKAGHETRNAVAGLDIGPSIVAIASEADAALVPFCPTVEQPWKETKRIQRAMDRSRRATNPENYNEDGTIKKGKKSPWIKSSRYRGLQIQLGETERRLASERKRSHGELANRILAMGSTIKTEKLSYLGFQKSFGRSVKVRAPGIFVSMLARKAESAGGGLETFSTRSTKLSQVCLCGAVKKKPLSQRTHVCDCGTGSVQRDLFSAYLARFVFEDRLDASRANLAWPGAEPLLRRAASGFRQPASGDGSAVSRVPRGAGAGRPPKGTGAFDESAHVVPMFCCTSGGAR